MSIALTDWQREFESPDIPGVKREFQFERRSEVSDLPTDCAVGSRALCEEDNSVWYLTISKTWKEIV